MTIFSISTAVVGKIWAIFLFPPRFFAKNGRWGHFHRGGRQNMRIFSISTAVVRQKMTILRKTTAVVRLKMVIFTLRTMVAAITKTIGTAGNTIFRRM